MSRWIVLVGVLLIAGCGSMDSPEKLRDKVDPYVVSSLKNYDDLYSLLNQRIKACHETADQQIKSALYTDRDRGAIAVSSGDVYKILVEVFKSPEGYGSQITIHSRDDTLGERVHSWIQGDTEC
ncbi:MAG: hypothetical protein HQ511_10010 [Rhodospirillales bacterium]|nr:hypothetical protein [Rhodospirillales bacterium]